MADLTPLRELMAGAREAPPTQTTPLESRDGRPPSLNATRPAERLKGIPGDRQGNTFAAFDLAKNPGMKPAYERCLAVAEGREWCALLAGPYGTGKTHLAEAAIIATGYRGMFWKVPDFLRWIRAQVFDHGWPEDRIVGPYRDADGLVVCKGRDVRAVSA